MDPLPTRWSGSGVLTSRAVSPLRSRAAVQYSSRNPHLPGRRQHRLHFRDPMERSFSSNLPIHIHTRIGSGLHGRSPKCGEWRCKVPAEDRTSLVALYSHTLLAPFLPTKWRPSIEIYFDTREVQTRRSSQAGLRSTETWRLSLIVVCGRPIPVAGIASPTL